MQYCRQQAYHYTNNWRYPKLDKKRKHFAGIKETNLVLQNDKETFRDGRHSTNTLFQNAWYYKPISATNPKIELP
ncbi:MAG TPA: hypothetical protein VHN59_11235 [Chitinophagaceae bacterium]|nr:hypothetical protein [Chitinophagaceae bacterium]